MAPSTPLLNHHHKMSPKEKNKLRKPAVEKMRRDRINSSIEQLKVLLEKEFHKQQPNVKLEKADILEMTVSYLSRQHGVHLKTEVPMGFKDGYSRCFDEVLHFFSLHQKQQAVGHKLINHYKSKEAGSISSCPAKCGQAKQVDVNTNSTIWRPW
ncbi:transcription factor HES-5-like isoform 2-T2 [Pelodytes ibericus]